MQTKLPWGHVIFPEAMMLRALREMYPETKLESVADLGLNKLQAGELRGMIRRQGLRAHYFRINVGGNPALRLFNLGRGLPGLSEYFTQNIYMILRPRIDRLVTTEPMHGPRHNVGLSMKKYLFSLPRRDLCRGEGGGDPRHGRPAEGHQSRP